MVEAPEVPPEECRFLHILKLPEVKISAPLTSLFPAQKMNYTMHFTAGGTSD